MSTTAFSIVALGSNLAIPSLVTSEAAAKFAMVLQAWAGKSARKGLNTPFIEAMHGRRGQLRFIIALCLMLAVALLAFRLTGLSVVLGTLLLSSVMLWISNRHFGGITGDVMGATNDLTRLASLLVVLVVAKWI